MTNSIIDELVKSLNDYAEHLILAYQPENIEENGIMALHYSFGSLDENRTDFIAQLREKLNLILSDYSGDSSRLLIEKLDSSVSEWQQKFNDIYDNVNI